MKHVIRRNGNYYYNRRVPDVVKNFDNRETIRVALGTDSRDTAIRIASNLNVQIEQYWRLLVSENKPYTDNEFNSVVQLARLWGFNYVPASKLSEASLENVVSRIKSVSENVNEIDVKAILGGVENTEQEMNVSKALEKYWSLAKDRSMNKSQNQLRKWENPRKKAIRNFISVIGDIPLKKITRNEILQFRDWWIERVDDGLNEGSANKDFIHLKTIIELVNENEKLELDTEHLFKKITLKERFSQARKPLDSEFIQSTLLNHENLKGLTDEAKYFLYAMADTGARLSELAGLEAEDIHLNEPIPYISIKDRKCRPLKTPHSERDIPLVGSALYAFKNCPHGFSSYRDNPDVLSTYLNKNLRANNLLPSEKHSVYSLRHSFQDRLLAVNAPDRVQAELMGHKFGRPRYGDGATLKMKSDWLKKICFSVSTNQI